MKYPMKEKKTINPIFNYMVIVNGEFDYYLYITFNDALTKAKELSCTNRCVLIYECAFKNDAREFFGHNTFTIYNGIVTYDKHNNWGLHLSFYVNSGEWLNPNQEWIDILEREKRCANLKTQNGRMLADTIIPMNVDDVWVSTKDRLPDKHDMYIVAWTDETIPTPPNEIHFYEMLEFDKDGWDFFNTVLDENSTVIAWQPLPKPYCEVKK
jgi:Protein of unknown function (DUF551).